MNAPVPPSQVRDRYLATLEIVRRELNALDFSYKKLSSITMDKKWIESLEQDMEAAEGVEAYVSRFGRLQDTMGDKLLPRALAVTLEIPGSMIDNLNRAERLGWIDDATAWAAVRGLRNRIIHEYMVDAQRFADDLIITMKYVPRLREIYQRFLALAGKQFGVTETDLKKYI